MRPRPGLSWSLARLTLSGADMLSLGSPRPLPLSVPLLGCVIGFVLMLGFRLGIRSQREGALQPRLRTSPAPRRRDEEER